MSTTGEPAAPPTRWARLWDATLIILAALVISVLGALALSFAWGSSTLSLEPVWDLTRPTGWVLPVWAALFAGIALLSRTLRIARLAVLTAIPVSIVCSVAALWDMGVWPSLWIVKVLSIALIAAVPVGVVAMGAFSVQALRTPTSHRPPGELMRRLIIIAAVVLIVGGGVLSLSLPWQSLTANFHFTGAEWEVTAEQAGRYQLTAVLSLAAIVAGLVLATVHRFKKLLVSGIVLLSLALVLALVFQMHAGHFR